MKKTLTSFLIMTCLFFVFSLSASADGTNTMGNRSGNGMNNNSTTTNSYRTNAATNDNNNFDWGWLGLLGLIGLAGLRKQKHERT